MNQYSQGCPDNIELTATREVKSFSQFWEGQADECVKVADEFSAPTTPGLLQSHITMATSNILLEGALNSVLFGIPSTMKSLSQRREQSIQEFSRNVSNYATSHDVIAALSDEIGPPIEHEDEEQFVSRAKQALREILSRRFRA